MQLKHSLQLAYCTNAHRGESWEEVFYALQQHTLAVRDRICPHQPFAIGLRLSAVAATELSNPGTLLEFRRWLGKHSCYVFTINGFPYGQFHGRRVKEHVYNPDWVLPERVAYTNLLFNLLVELLPPGIEGSVSTVPGTVAGYQLPASKATWETVAPDSVILEAACNRQFKERINQFKLEVASARRFQVRVAKMVAINNFDFMW